MYNVFDYCISITSCNWNCNLHLGTYQNVSQNSHLKKLQQFRDQKPCISGIWTDFLEFVSSMMFFSSSEIPEVSESLHFISLGEGIYPKGHTSPGKWPIVYVLKTSSDKIIYWIGRYSFLLVFSMSKNPKGLWFYILIKSSVLNLSQFFDIIKPRRKEYLA